MIRDRELDIKHPSLSFADSVLFLTFSISIDPVGWRGKYATAIKQLEQPLGRPSQLGVSTSGSVWIPESGPSHHLRYCKQRKTRIVRVFFAVLLFTKVLSIIQKSKQWPLDPLHRTCRYSLRGNTSVRTQYTHLGEGGWLGTWH